MIKSSAIKPQTKISGILLICLSFTFLLSANCLGQQSTGSKYLVPQKSITLPGVKGRIDHMAINIHDMKVYIAAYGNNTLEVVSLKKGKDIHRITGLYDPQGVCYIPRNHEIFVANGGNGEGYFYNARNYKKIAVIHFSSDADDVFYDAHTDEIYVAYGEGGIAVINADTHKKIKDYPLPAHPERFKLDSKSHQIFVNLPDFGQIDVINLKQSRIVKKWENSLLSLPKYNFPMALDTIHNRLFIGYRLPPRLEILNSKNGKKIASFSISRVADDMYYNYKTERIYVSCGGGKLDIIKQKGPDTYQKIVNMTTRPGARTALLVPALHLYLLAEPTFGNKKARLMVYRTK